LICEFNNNASYVVLDSKYWRLSLSEDINVKGLFFLKTKRHVEHLSELKGYEAMELGGLLKKASIMCKEEGKAKRVIVMSLGFSEPHVHFWIIPVTDKTESDLLQIKNAVRRFADKYRKGKGK